MINQSIVVGRLTKTPELRYTPSGAAVTNFTVACNKPKKDGKDQGADFINCVAWNKQAENLCNYQTKGALIGVTGRTTTRSYEDNSGKKVYVQEILAQSIQFLEFRDNNGGNSNTSNQGTAFDEGETMDIQDDDLPF
ncbi:single-stranded DNA-binding protein [Bacillus phage poppyseed]|uniref:Single-stranded DNA-binding protein n=4 Tax=Pagevirus TaxID=1921184 RepID=A0A0A0RT45_9CAUD|nr:single strand DNA binding protein [Bacillus phage Page]YP_009152850.1 single strand DNA binding protein [Bacillus phage Pookie]YP_009197518.1 single strand DNA binding protein [Bacillus phage Pavlov]YP_009210084.1 single strand DNA binding protein [Bacillus phage Palmer]AGY48066.1 single-stranded DNA-binding protein [Bacillus phage poppyseed]AGY47971.1 single-stranded DNA-binding protein [Bacillus phage Page]AIW03736.1 ssDNA-binding protein [Bacillus phage Pookie]AJK28116.1 single-strande